MPREMFTVHGLPVTRRTLGFSVFRFWPFFGSVFRFTQQKTAVIRFWCLLRFSGFPSIIIWFSVSGKNTGGFSDLALAVVFGFSHLVSGFSEVMQDPAAKKALEWPF